MIVTKQHLPRRTILRGLGATIALPFLDAMVPALTASAQTAANPVPRLGFFYVPNGMFLPNFHPQGNGGTNFTLSPTLTPLEPFRDQLVVLSGLSNSELVSPHEGGGTHSRAHGGWLSGVRPKRAEGADLQGGKTIDQYAADTLGADTVLRSLELTIDSNFQVGNCENGYSCAYLNSSSWRTATSPLPHERDPRVVFQRLFGDGGSVESRRVQMRIDRSLLDSVSESIGRLEKRLGLRDRTTVEEYLDAVRESERRIQRAEQQNSTTPLPEVNQPAGVPDDYEEHVKLLQDLLVLAFRGDVTRVSCMQLSREISGRTYPTIGVPEGHHTVSHHQMDSHNIEQYTKINTYHMSLFARFLEQVRAIPDGDGTLLDHSMFMWAAGMGDGDHHTPYDLPISIVGGGCGTLEGGRHLKYPLHTPFMNCGLSVLDKVGVHLDKIADSTGRLTDL